MGSLGPDDLDDLRPGESMKTMYWFWNGYDLLKGQGETLGNTKDIFWHRHMPTDTYIKHILYKHITPKKNLESD